MGAGMREKLRRKCAMAMVSTPTQMEHTTRGTGTKTRCVVRVNSITTRSNYCTMANGGMMSSMGMGLSTTIKVAIG